MLIILIRVKNSTWARSFGFHNIFLLILFITYIDYNTLQHTGLQSKSCKQIYRPVQHFFPLLLFDIVSYLNLQTSSTLLSITVIWYCFIFESISPSALSPFAQHLKEVSVTIKNTFTSEKRSEVLGLNIPAASSLFKTSMWE